MAEADQTLLDAIKSLDAWTTHHLLRIAHEPYSDQSQLAANEAANLAYLLRQQLSMMRPLWKDDAQALQNDYIASQV
jgi:hypothetical protein